MTEVAKTADTALTESLSGFVDQLTQVTKLITEQVINKAPEAAGLMLDALQLRALIDILTTLPFFIAVFLLASRAYKNFEQANKAGLEHRVIYGGACFAGAFLCGMVSIGLFNSGVWIMVINPAAGLALEVFDKVVR